MKPRGTGVLAERFESALDRIGAYFMGSSPLQEAAAQIARLLTELKIDYRPHSTPRTTTESAPRDRGRA